MITLKIQDEVGIVLHLDELNSLIVKLMNSLLLCLLILGFSCNNDDNTPENPVDALPPATQTGEQTFGCLIDGKPFFPDKFGGGWPTAFYQISEGGYTSVIRASRRNDEPSKSISIGALDIEGFSETTYILKTEQAGEIHGKYLIGGGINYRGTTNSENTGTLTITRFDEQQHIISGTFEFTVQDENGIQIKITNGRFDLNYSN